MNIKPIALFWAALCIRAAFCTALLSAILLSGCNARYNNLSQSDATKSNTTIPSEIPAAYPPFSWDTVPVYAHFGRMAGDLSPQENEFLASRYDFIALEKGHGLKQHGSSEKGIIAGAKMLKDINPQMKVLFYWNGLLDYPLYDAHYSFSEIDGGALTTVDGTLDLKRGKLKKYDLSNPEVRTWWVQVAKKVVEEGNLDGVFIDAFPQISLKPANNIEILGKARFEALEEGVIKLLEETNAALGPEKLLIYNGIRSVPGGWEDGGLRYLPYTNGVITEHFDQFQSTTPDMIELDMHRMMKAAKAGKIVIFKAWPGFNFTQQKMMQQSEQALYELAKEAIDFPLACFLIVAQPYSYFNYTWGYRDIHGALDWYPEFDKKLGPPIADATQDGWLFTRKFEHASVTVNIETKQSTIEWH